MSQVNDAVIKISDSVGLIGRAIIANFEDRGIKPFPKKVTHSNSYPINNNRGHAAKQKRQAKKRKNK